MTYFHFSIDSFLLYLHCFYKEKIICFTSLYKRNLGKKQDHSSTGFHQDQVLLKKFIVHLFYLIYLRESQRNKCVGVLPATLLTIKLPHILFSTAFNRVVEYLFCRMLVLQNTCSQELHSVTFSPLSDFFYSMFLFIFYIVCSYSFCPFYQESVFCWTYVAF